MSREIRKEMTTFYTFFCARCYRKTLTVAARGYWKTIKEWICDECKKEEEEKLKS